MNKFIPALGALILSALSVFFVFGFLASGELSAAEALPWKVGYGTLFIASAMGALTLATKLFRSRA